MEKGKYLADRKRPKCSRCKGQQERRCRNEREGKKSEMQGAL